MKLHRGLWLNVLVIILAGCQQASTIHTPEPCSQAWVQQRVESKLQSGDGQGHGPDLDSMEWRSVIEFKLGVRGDAALPSREGEEWCRYIDKLVFNP